MPADALVPPKLPIALKTIELDELDDEELLEGLEVRGDLVGAVAAGVTFDSCRLVGLRLPGADLARLKLRDCVLETCDLSGAFLEESSWQRVALRDCRLNGAVLTGSTWRHAAFDGCQGSAAAFRFATADHLRLNDSRLDGSDWTGTRLTDAELTSCDLSTAELSQAKLECVTFRSCQLDDLRGALALRGATIDIGSIVPVALSLFAAVDITIADD